MNAILALQNLPETLDSSEELDAVTGHHSAISVLSDCTSSIVSF